MAEKDIEKELFDTIEEIDQDKQSKEDLPKEDKKESKKVKKSKLEDQLDTVQVELEEMKDKYFRNLAELENYKKRTTNELIKERRYASQTLTDKLVDSMEVFSQALNMKTNDKQMENFLYGFKMIKDMMFNSLEEEGLSIIETKVGDIFDPNIHEAMDVEYDPEKKEHSILKISKSGYRFKDRVLRPTLVVINLKPENTQEINDENIDENIIKNGEDE